MFYPGRMKKRHQFLVGFIGKNTFARDLTGSPK